MDSNGKTSLRNARGRWPLHRRGYRGSPTNERREPDVAGSRPLSQRTALFDGRTDDVIAAPLRFQPGVSELADQAFPRIEDLVVAKPENRHVEPGAVCVLQAVSLLLIPAEVNGPVHFNRKSDFGKEEVHDPLAGHYVLTPKPASQNAVVQMIENLAQCMLGRGGVSSTAVGEPMDVTTRPRPCRELRLSNHGWVANTTPGCPVAAVSRRAHGRRFCHRKSLWGRRPGNGDAVCGSVAVRAWATGRLRYGWPWTVDRQFNVGVEGARQDSLGGMLDHRGGGPDLGRGVTF